MDRKKKLKKDIVRLKSKYWTSLTEIRYCVSKM